MISIKTMGLLTTVIFTVFLNADANVILDDKLNKSKLLEVAGKSSRYNHEEHFPHDYFLIPKNLPYAFKIVLYHSESSELGLSKNKIQTLIEMKKKTKPIVLKMAKEIKLLELSLVTLIESHIGSVKITDEMDSLIHEISMKKAQLTKVHIKCILKVQSLLSAEEKRKVNILIDKF